VPIDHRIDHARRLVVAEGRGTVTDEEVFRYQREVWSRSDVVGYDELIDMSGAGEIVEGPRERMRALAELSAASDPPAGTSKLAIVAPQDLAFGVARMYQAYRELTPRSTKTVSVFRARDAALRWLASEDPRRGAPPHGPGQPSAEP
jgi:hypothetical protein